jgi:mannose-1-phosphate guanylyltransferase/MurNAc alpha-1-phosphate uridylyltransferase
MPFTVVVMVGIMQHSRPMGDIGGELAGVVLAAGAGTRLRPLTLLRPKVLCPVANVPLVDLAIERVAAVTSSIAVNVHHWRDQLESHLARRVHLSVEEREPLGTAGALGHLRPWIDGRPTVVVNGDSWCPDGLPALVDGWDGERIRLLLVGEDRLTASSRLAGALMPWRDVSALADEPSGLYESMWREAAAAGRIEVVRHEGPFVDCGTPAQYHAANMAASGGRSVISPGAVVEGEVVRCVVWPGSYVRAGEHLVDAIRVGPRLTVLVR